MKRRTGVLVAATCAATLGISATATAATRVVFAGGVPGANKIASKLVPKNFGKKYSPGINAFFGRRTTINVGDKVSFILAGFHTIDLPGKSNSDLPLITTSGMVTGALDAAGNPFWFNGKVPNVGLNPQLFRPIGGKTYNGTNRIDSGLPLRKPKPLNVKFTKPGVYKFFCDVHPGMVGYVVVKPKGKPIPSAAQVAAGDAAQFVSDVKAAKKVVKQKLPADTVDLGQSTKGGVELYAMFPRTLKVPANTTVKFTMSHFSRETHTATFGPHAFLKPILQSFAGANFNAIGVYPSDVPSIVLTPTSHGDGFANVGALDNDPGTPQIPSSGKIDFTTPGVYHFQCLIHPFMHGTIVVQ